MKPKFEWIDKALLHLFEAEGTTAHRLCTTDDGWVERFGRDILISYQKADVRERLMKELDLWSKNANLAVDRIFGRLMAKQNEPRATPQLLLGEQSDDPQTIVTERKLKFRIDFGSGYSVGLFLDQRENRGFVRQTAPKRLLNCFAYTCSFSVAAASVGGRTVNVDLSKKSLARGRENFAFNSLPTSDHRFIADDVRAVLRRLTRRCEKFDAIILDPPTFARARRGKDFRIEDDFEDLLLAALTIAERRAHILLSSNCATFRQSALELTARDSLGKLRRTGSLHQQPQPADFPPDTGASSVWLTLR